MMRSTFGVVSLVVSVLVFCPPFGAGAAPHGEQGPEGPAAPEEMSAEEAAMMEAFQASMTPGPEHEALAAMAGTYDMKVTMWEDPEAEPETVTGTAERSMILGGRVLEERVSAEFMGMPFVGEARTGYDNVTESFWSTWIDNMSTGLFHSTGERLEDGTIEMVGKGPNPVAGGLLEQKGVIRTEEDGSERHTMYEKREGEWVKTMEIVYTRR